MSILDYIEKIKRENEGPRIVDQEPRNMELAKAGIPRHLWTNMNTPDLEQSPDSFLRPGETLENWDTSFRRPNAQGGRIKYDEGSSYEYKIQQIMNKHPGMTRPLAIKVIEAGISPDDYDAIAGLESKAEGGRIGYDDGQLVRNTADGSRPGYQGRYITSDKYTGVFTEPAGPRSPKRIRFEVTYMDNEGKRIKFTSKPVYSSQAKAYEGKLKKIAEVEKDLGIGKGNLFDQVITQRRVQKSYLPKNKKNYIHVKELAELLGVSKLDPVGTKQASSTAKVAAKILDQTTI